MLVSNRKIKLNAKLRIRWCTTLKRPLSFGLKLIDTFIVFFIIAVYEALKVSFVVCIVYVESLMGVNHKQSTIYLSHLAFVWRKRWRTNNRLTLLIAWTNSWNFINFLLSLWYFEFFWQFRSFFLLFAFFYCF